MRRRGRSPAGAGAARTDLAAPASSASRTRGSAPVLGTLVSVAIVLAAAHLGGASPPARQPAVIGQLLAGVVIGPTVLGARSGDLLSADTCGSCATSAPSASSPSRSPSARGSTGTPAAAGPFAAMAAVVFGVPFLAGLAVAFWLFAGHDAVDGATVDRLPFVLFVVAAISITAFRCSRGSWRTTA